MTSFGFKISELREKLRIYIYIYIYISDPLSLADPFCPTPEGRGKKSTTGSMS